MVEDSSDTAYFLAMGGGIDGTVERFAFNSLTTTITLTDPISIPTWAVAPNALQPNKNMLDTGDGRFKNTSIQNGTSLWNVHAVKVGGLARGRFFHFSTTGTSPLFTKDLFTTNDDYIWNLSVATNATQAFVAASRTIPSQQGTGNASIVMFHGSKTSDTGWTYDVIATSPQQYVGCSTGCRWGDFSSTQIDPSDNSKAWGFNQLVTGESELDWLNQAGLVGDTPEELTALSPAKVWIGLKNSDDVGLRVDLMAEVLKDGALIGSGQLTNVWAGSSGFNNASLQSIALALSAGPVEVPAGAVLAITVSARRTCSGPGHSSGTVRLWYSGPPIDSGSRRSAGSRFDATIDATSVDFFLRTGSALSQTAGTSTTAVDAFVNSVEPCPARRYTSLGTWSITLP